MLGCVSASWPSATAIHLRSSSCPEGGRRSELALGSTEFHPSSAPLVNRLEQRFVRQLTPLSDRARQLLLVAAAEPVGDLPLLWGAAERLGLGVDAATTAESAGLIELHGGIRFRHPIVRSAVYRAASPAQRRQVHQALADATNAEIDPSRHARAAVAPDESVAGDLERSAERALSLGGLAAAASFLQTAAALTPDPARRAQRSLDAGQAKATASLFREALTLLAAAEAGPLDELGRARIDLLRAQISFNSSHGEDAFPLLLAAAHPP
jgi:hypothetical protein